MSGAGLEWWELLSLNGDPPVTFKEFKEKLLEHFEPVNRERNARRMLNELRQMGKFSTIRAYNQEFSKWLLQVPSMTVAEQLFHYGEGLKAD